MKRFLGVSGDIQGHNANAWLFEIHKSQKNLFKNAVPTAAADGYGFGYCQARVDMI